MGELTDEEARRVIEIEWSLPEELREDWLDVLIKEYENRWTETMPEKGKEFEQSVLHGMHFEVGNILKRLIQIRKAREG